MECEVLVVYTRWLWCSIASSYKPSQEELGRRASNNEQIAGEDKEQVVVRGGVVGILGAAGLAATGSDAD